MDFGHLTLFLGLVSAASIFDSVSPFADNTKFIVKIKVKTKNGINSTCAGTIISHNAVLTAAHCVHGADPADVYAVQLTPTGYSPHRVDAIAIHPDFHPPTIYNDVSLIRIDGNFTPPWKAVVLNDAPIRGSLRTYDNCVMIGWMVTETPGPELRYRLDVAPSFDDGADTLRLVAVPVSLINGLECSRIIKNFGGTFEGDKKLCGVGDDRRSRWCSIGSGGPLLCSTRAASRTRAHLRWEPEEPAPEYAHLRANDTLGDPLDLLAAFRMDDDGRAKRSAGVETDYQMGIVSWGRIYSKIPSVFVRTDAYYDWVKAAATALGTDDLQNYTGTFGTTSGYLGIHHRIPMSFVLIITLSIWR